MDTAKASVLQINQGACCEWAAPFSVVEHGEDKFILHMNFKRPQEIWDSQTWSMLGQDFVLVRATEIKRQRGLVLHATGLLTGMVIGVLNKNH